MPQRLRVPPHLSPRTRVEYVVALDDSGRKGLQPGGNRPCFFFGGIIVPTSNLGKLTRCFSAAQGVDETKTQSFTEEWGGSYSGLLSTAVPEHACASFLDGCAALVLAIAIDKSNLSEASTIPTRKGGRRVDPQPCITLLAQALESFLRHNGGRAELLVDRMASEAENEAIQRVWQAEAAASSRLPKTLQFKDSKTSIPIQAADVVMGLIRDAHESKRVLTTSMAQLLRRSQAAGLPVMHLQ